MSTKLITNKTESSFLEVVKDELKHCDRFNFSVSFIKHAGLRELINDIEDALKRGAVGRILTSTYQNFTDIPSLEILFDLEQLYSNFTVKVFDSKQTRVGFHTKGYLFQQNDDYKTLIGSTNITRFALLSNIEWNMWNQSNDSTLHNDVLGEFDQLWVQSIAVTELFISEYKKTIDQALNYMDADYILNTTLSPNQMQIQALKELERYRNLGVKRSLVISATGSGKTYLAAFDVANYGPKKSLFIVHRENIVRDAMETYRNVITNKTMGLFTGTNKNSDVDYLFATPLSLVNSLDLFQKDEFEYIVVDEAHHIVSDTYKKLVDYFNPEFLLGLTATPERMDAQNIFDVFDKNVPYELRLRDAIQYDLVCPFHYYGISDSYVDLDKELSSFLYHSAKEEHVEFIVGEIEKRLELDTVKSLVFCRNTNHAQIMADAFNNYGINTKVVLGTTPIQTRLKLIEELQDSDDPLKMICTVDVFNEGVDIKNVNLVLFLRPTESSTIFLQQLGRGLRKSNNKEYLTVLDFVSNNDRSTSHIAMAISSLRENDFKDKRVLKNMIRNNFDSIALAGVHIELDEISKQTILDQIENTNFNKQEYIIEDYKNYKSFIVSEKYDQKQIDFVPLIEYLDSRYSPDPVYRFVRNKLKDYKGYKSNKNKSYYDFLKKISEKLPEISIKEEQFLEYIDSQLPLIRFYEYAIIKEMLDHSMNIKDIRNALIRNYEVDTTDLVDFNEEFDYTIQIMKNTDYFSLVKDTIVFEIDIDQSYPFVKSSIEYGLNRFKNEFKVNYNYMVSGHQKYALYSTMNYLRSVRYSSSDGTLPKNFQKGTQIKDKTVNMLVTVNKKKAKSDELSHLDYKDYFLDNQTFQWESTTNVTLENESGKKLINSENARLFIRNSADESGQTLDYMYIGDGKLTNPRQSSNAKKSLLFDFVLHEPVADYILEDFDRKDD